MKQKIILLFLFNVLFSICSAQEISPPKIIVSIDSTENNYIYVLSPIDQIKDLRLRSESCGRYYYEPLDSAISELFICVRDPKRSSYFAIGDTINDFIISTSLNSMDVAYTYIGLGEYLNSYPSMQLFFCDDSALFSNDYNTNLSTLSIIDKIKVDSYLIYLWLHQDSTTITDFTCYKDWFNYQICFAHDVVLLEKNQKTILVYYPNGILYKEIQCGDIKQSILIYENSNKSLVRLTVNDTSYVGLIDKSWIKRL